jgi:hypothetical protein
VVRLRLGGGVGLTVVGPGPGGGVGLEVVGLMAGLGLATTGADLGEPGLALDAGALEGSGVTAALAGDGPATTRAAKGTRKAGVTCGGNTVLLLPP